MATTKTPKTPVKKKPAAGKPAFDKELEKLVRAHGKVYKRNFGEIIRLELDTDHYYFLSKLGFIPGVTSILDEAGPVGYGLREFWRQNTAAESDDILTTASAFGSKMHDVYERLLNGIKIDALAEGFHQREHKSAIAFMEWFNGAKPRAFQSEQIIASKKYMFGGTLDFVGYIKRKDVVELLTGLTAQQKKTFLEDKPDKEEFWLIDFKTSKALHYNHELQVTAYKQAYFESFGIMPDRVGLLRLGTKNSSGYEFREVRRPLQAFLNLYNTYLELHGGVIPQPKEIVAFPESYQLLIEEADSEVASA